MQRSEETVWTPNSGLTGNTLLDPIEDTEIIIIIITIFIYNALYIQESQSASDSA
jgi:hypothetical protein